MSGAFGFVDWRRVAVVALPALVLLAALPAVLSTYLIHVVTLGFYFTILAASWNLLAGMTGQFSLAQQTFAAIGAYGSGLLIVWLRFPLWLAMPCGVVVAAALGFTLGRLVLRMRAIYLAIATWAFAETVHVLLTAAYSITRGEQGLSVPSLYGSLEPVLYYYTLLPVTAAIVLGLYILVRSPLGYFMRAIKDDELRAQTLGVDTTRVKVLVFTLTSGISGLAGVLYAHYMVVLSPQMADFSEMAKLIIMVVVGGLGTFAGPLVGAPLVHIILTYLQKYGEWDMVVFALIVIALMRSTMGGLVALAAEAYQKLRGPRAGPA
ncbi:MAG TPA: branched-chain amino acid ABC transporter permease [Stellaceae bacterium]|jgi:branched-chain amino acid transport system permease protein|nr:branched-chain amino acid ABC transporter permease [Stellaceae bacterium]